MTWSPVWIWNVMMLLLSQGLPVAVLSEQRHQFCGRLCDLLHLGFHVLRTECSHLRSGRIWWGLYINHTQGWEKKGIKRICLYTLWSVLDLISLRCVTGLRRSGPGLHSLPPRCEHDAFLASVGCPLLHHDCFPGAWQPGTKYTQFHQLGLLNKCSAIWRCSEKNPTHFRMI